MLRYRLLIARGYETIFTLAAVFLLFVGCNEVVELSGLLAVTLAGVVVGNLETRVDDQLREFKDRLTVLLVGLLFVLLSADVALADVLALGTSGAVVVASLIIVIKPISIWISTYGLNLTSGRSGIHECHRTMRNRGGCHRLDSWPQHLKTKACQAYRNLESPSVPRDRRYCRRVWLGSPTRLLGSSTSAYRVAIGSQS